MNCPSRNDNISEHPSWNQSPGHLPGDLTTRQDLNGITNLRLSRDHLPLDDSTREQAREMDLDGRSESISPSRQPRVTTPRCHSIVSGRWISCLGAVKTPIPKWRSLGRFSAIDSPFFRRFMTFLSFVGPGFLVAVAYIDPGNYATDVAAGAATRFQLLFVVLMSNIFAVILQSLSIRLGTVTGMNLAEHCRAYLPKWLNLAVYVLAEAAIIATDIAEVSSLSEAQARDNIEELKENPMITGMRLK